MNRNSLSMRISPAVFARWVHAAVTFAALAACQADADTPSDISGGNQNGVDTDAELTHIPGIPDATVELETDIPHDEDGEDGEDDQEPSASATDTPVDATHLDDVQIDGDVQTDSEVDANPDDALSDAPDAHTDPIVVDVLIMFLDTGVELGTPVDVMLNETWYRFLGVGIDDELWDSQLLNARGLVVRLDEPLASLRFDRDQIHVDGLNNHGFGLFNYVVQRRSRDTNLRNLDVDPDSTNFYAGGDEGYTLLRARNGFNETFAPNPQFYELELDTSWSNTGQIAIRIGGHGRNHPSYGPDEHP